MVPALPLQAPLGDVDRDTARTRDDSGACLRRQRAGQPTAGAAIQRTGIGHAVFDHVGGHEVAARGVDEACGMYKGQMFALRQFRQGTGGRVQTKLGRPRLDMRNGIARIGALGGDAQIGIARFNEVLVRGWRQQIQSIAAAA